MLLSLSLSLATALARPSPSLADAVLPIATRLARRSFPSIFEAGAPADAACSSRGAESPLDPDSPQVEARHDLVFKSAAALGYAWRADGELEPASIALAQARRAELARLNPNIVVLAQVFERAPDRLRRDCAQLAAAGAIDGVLLSGASGEAAPALIAAARAGLGPSAVIVVPEPAAPLPRAAVAATNGFYFLSGDLLADWRARGAALHAAELELRKPVVDLFETSRGKARDELFSMRMATAIPLLYGDGFALFADPPGAPTAHRHDLYAFWKPSLGRPQSQAFQAKDGTIWRVFEGGDVVFDPPDNPPVTVEFPTLHTSLGRGLTAKRLTVLPGDADIFVKKLN